MNLWIKLPHATHQVFSYNKHYNEAKGVWEFWVTRNNGKNLILAEGKEADVQQMKDMFDLAVKTKDNIIELA